MSGSKLATDNEPARILWTGGWDSTFQLLCLVLVEKRLVEPHYLIDEKRISTGTELLTMKRIREKIYTLSAPAAALILNTRLFLVSEIPAIPAITNAYHEIRNQNYIGRQYDWFARYCEFQGITGLQLCIHEDDKAAVVVKPCIAVDHDGHRQPAIDQQHDGTNVHALFRYFHFPLLELTKKDVASAAEGNGWSDIMEMTWFCHNPRRGRPCGRCSPCRYTIEEGFAHRIPMTNRLTAGFNLLILRPVKNAAGKLLQAVRGKS